MVPKALRSAGAAETFADWLRSIAGLDTATVVEEEGRTDLRVTLADGATATFEVKAAAHPTTADLEPELTRRSKGSTGGAGRGRPLVVVADLLSEESRNGLRAAGVSYFDRRGEAFLRVGPSTAHVVGPAAPRLRGAAKRVDLGAGAGKMTVALAALVDPERRVGVRALARASGLAAMTISEARRDLRDAALLDADHRAVTDALFDALAAAWAPRRTRINQIPEPAQLGRLAAGYRTREENPEPLLTEELDLLYDPDGRADRYEGAALGGDRAAIERDAPLVAPLDAPFAFYVPDDDALERVVAWGTGRREPVTGRRDDAAVATVAVAPTRLACRLRSRGGRHGYPLVHPLVTAIELAHDPARGREALDAFNPPGVIRVW